MFRHLFRRERLGRARRVAAATAALALTAVAGLSVASPAHAEAFPIADNFSDSLKWTTGEVANLTSAIVGAFPAARSAPNVAYLDAYPVSPAAAKVFRAITLDNGARPPVSCQAKVWLQPVAMPAHGNVQVFLRVHNGGPTGQIISVIGYDETIYPPIPAHWEQVAFSAIPWPSNTRTITVEIAAYRGVVMADDLTISCA